MPSSNTLLIAGLPVYIRPLPSGDLVVWHPYNDQLRKIVEPLCRTKGHWQPDYNNWVIWRHYRETVIAALRAIGEDHA
jgi:uncharacterized membrane protein